MPKLSLLSLEENEGPKNKIILPQLKTSLKFGTNEQRKIDKKDIEDIEIIPIKRPHSYVKITYDNENNEVVSGVYVYIKHHIDLVVKTDKTGKFLIDEIPTGYHDLIAVYSGGFTGGIGFAVFNDKISDLGNIILYTGSKITGKVVLEAGVSNGDVIIGFDGTSYQTISARTGEFSFDWVLPGCYTMRIRKSGYLTIVKDDKEKVCIEKAQTVDLGEISLFKVTSSCECPEDEICTEDGCIKNSNSDCSVEICNGEDDDCDGIIDEYLAEFCIPEEIESNCEFGTRSCSHGSWGLCVAGTSSFFEICDDNIDSDCDGFTDFEDTDCCVPDCEGKECGFDGCFSECGSCSGELNQVCSLGLCVSTCIEDSDCDNWFSCIDESCTAKDDDNDGIFDFEDGCLDSDNDDYGKAGGGVADCLGADCNDEIKSCNVDCNTDVDDDEIFDCEDNCIDVAEFITQVGGLPSALFATNDYLYMGFGPNLEIFSLTTNILQELPVKQIYLDGNIKDIKIKEGYAFLANSDKGLMIIDVTDPAEIGEPVIIGTQGHASGVFVKDNYAYIADLDQGLSIINIANPLEPEFVSSVDTNGLANKVYVFENFAYIADYESGLAIIDVSDVNNLPEPVYKDTSIDDETSGYAYDVFVKDNYAYIANGKVGFAIIDVSNPNNPGQIIHKAIQGRFEKVYVKDNHAYLSANWQGLVVIDLSDPENPQEPIYKETNGTGMIIHGKGNILYLACENGLAIFDISVPSNLFYEKKQILGNVVSVFSNDNKVFIADEKGAAAVVDVLDHSNTFNPTFIHKSSDTTDIFVYNNYAYLAATWQGLLIIDISNPFNPGEPVSAISLGTYNHIRKVFVFNNTAFAIDESSLFIIDVADPDNPSVPVIKNTANILNNIFVSGDYAYIAADEAGLMIIDVSNISSPFDPVYIDTVGKANDVFIMGNYAYIADGEEGLVILDVTNPVQPNEIAKKNTLGVATGVNIANGFAYIADSHEGVAVIDISNPELPGRAVYYKTYDRALDTVTINNYLYTASGHGGLYIYQEHPECVD